MHEGCTRGYESGSLCAYKTRFGCLCWRVTRAAVLILALLLGAAANAAEIDQRSYNLGILGGFSEVVRLGVKKLALSEVMSPADMDALDGGCRSHRHAERGYRLWREPDLIVTDLYPADVVEGKHVLLIYTGNTLDEYMQLKKDKAALVAAGKYTGDARLDIARRFGRMLSYPEPVIDDLIARQAKVVLRKII